MRSLADAQREVLGAMETLETVRLPLGECMNLVLASDVHAPHAVPPFPNSGMDGFAVLSSDVAVPPSVLEVVEEVAAGAVPTRAVAPGTAIKIMTGAPIPEGADAIVKVEDTEQPDPGRVRISTSASPGDHIRPAGGDMAAGDLVLAAGSRLGPVHLGALAALGEARPEVRRRPVVAVMSTGDELVAVEAPELRPGSIRDSNRPMLVGALKALGVEVLDLGIVPDDPRLLRSTLGEAADKSDAVVTSGGVSMGEYDLVKEILSDAGTVDFWQVAMQPAKPFAFGRLSGTPLFGLPGNPVSVMVAFEQFLRPALLRMMGARLLFRPRSTATLTEAVDTNPEKVVFLRVRAIPAEEGMTAAPSGGQGSNVLSALAAADALAVVPVGVGRLAAGERVELEWFRSPEARTYEEVLDG